MWKVMLAAVLMISSLMNMAHAAQPLKILILFRAKWCPGCHVIRDNVIADKKFIKYCIDRKIYYHEVDVDKYPDYAEQTETTTIPKLMLIETDWKTSRKLWEKVGPISKEEVMQQIR